MNPETIRKWILLTLAVIALVGVAGGVASRYFITVEQFNEHDRMVLEKLSELSTSIAVLEAEASH